MYNLIGNIELRPSVVKPGETVRVEVCDPPKNTTTGTEFSINGIPGPLQYMQFPTEGGRRIVVRARTTNGKVEQKTALLNVTGVPLEFIAPDSRADIAMISVTQSHTQPYTSIFTLGSRIDMRSPHVLSTIPQVSPLPKRAVKRRLLVSRLGKIMMENASAQILVETRRLINTRSALATATRTRTRTKSSRFVIGAVYDLTHVDIKNALTTNAQVYEWDFGDGATATTCTPTVSHDYFKSINHVSGIGQFVVTCQAKHSKVTVQRTLTIYSAYAICKATGTIVPHVTADLFAHKRYNMLTTTFTVHNVEDTPIVLDQMSITPRSVDKSSIALPNRFVALDTPVTIQAKSAAMVGVNIPYVTSAPAEGQLSFDVEGFTVLYAGTTGKFPVRCSATFDIPVSEWSKRPTQLVLPRVPGPRQRKKPWPWDIVQEAMTTVVNPANNVAMLDVKTGTMAVSLGLLQSTGPKAALRDVGMQVLSAVHAPIEVAMAKARCSEKLTISEKTKETFEFVYHTLEGPPMPGPIEEGQICDPDNLTEEELALANEGQLVCQLTDEVKEVVMPAQWMNARKGDCILSPGGDGIIGGMMLQVKPAQWYSHCGIMTRNYEEITHSTGSQARLMDHLVGVLGDGSDGFEPRVLKYIWPGAVTQTVQHSVEGENFPDPEYDKSYSISSFGSHTVGVTHNDQMKMIPPLVLKPDPLQETVAVRSKLQAIATDARNNAGRPGIKPKYHYRWYCYTDPTIGQGNPETSEAGWAEGTHPSVCSSYIWMHAKARDAQLETSQALVTPTDLEKDPDLTQGATVSQTTADGLYSYSAEEREDAAYWLYNTIYNQAYEKAGWFGELLTDGADDIANQFLNAFANDNADGKDSDEWKNFTNADAVSPDNMIWWDGPSRGGLYGFVEPAIYREPRIEEYTVSRWKKVLSRGTISGKVFGNNGFAGGVLVQAYDGKTTFSDSSGGYKLTDVPLGDYFIKASKVIDGILYSAQVNTSLAAAELVVDIYLQPPADRYRIAQIYIDFYGRDEETFGDDEIKDPGPEYFELELGPDKTINSNTRTYKWGGEVRVEYTITVRLLVNNIIDVQVQGVLYEGTSEDTKDLDGQGGTTFQVGVDKTFGATLTITNTDEEDNDEGVLSISVKNVRNNN